MSTQHVRRTTEKSYTLESRSAGTPLATLPTKDEVVELDLGDGLVLLTKGGAELAAQVDHNPGERSGLPVLALRSEVPSERGAVSLAIKGLKVIGVDVEAWLGIDALKNYAADVIASKVAQKSDGREIQGRPGGPGLYHCDANTAYAGAFTSPSEASNTEMLVLVHGFLSSAAGAFGGLWQPGGANVREALLKHYRAVCCFDHPTLGESPVENALALAKSLPPGARLHLLAHSRGGMVCELLSRAQADQAGFRPRELELFEKVNPGDAIHLRSLIKLMREKELRVDRFVRAGSPMRGTWLASDRLDRWLSIFYNVVKHAIPPGPQLIADHVFDVLAAVVKEGLKREHFPGIEAMSPTSSLVALLNDAPPELRQRLTVIGGDCQGSGILHRIKVLLTDGFFGEPHDLVVPTASMFGGAPRAGGVRYFFHQTPRVDHFHYFSHSESLRRIQVGLIGDDAEFAKLQKIDRITERPDLTPNRAVRPDAPLNVVLPGIMGTELGYRKEDLLWVDLGEFACGNFPELRLDGSSHDQPYPPHGTDAVFPMEPLADFYGDLMRALASRGEIVVAGGYDWRKPIHIAADALADRLAQQWPEGSPRPLRIIAHSMGGLVARSLFARHPDLLKRFKASAQNRLLMLGTPNAGSMAIAKALLRDNKQIGWISALAPQSETELLTVAATFPGFHELLPQSGRIWAHQSVWDMLFQQRNIALDKRPALSVAAMTLGEQGRKALRDGIVTLPKENTIYVAGFVDQQAKDATVVDIDDEGRYVRGPGDGTVSYASGLIDGVPTYYAAASHGDLPKFRRAFSAYLELLDRGETAQLPKDWKSLQDSNRGVRLEALTPTQLPYRPSRGDLYRGLMGATAQATSSLKASHADEIRLRVVHGGLKFARHPLMVGHYLGDMMQGSEAELDRQFDGQLRKALELGVYPGPVETVQVFTRGTSDSGRSPYSIVVGLGNPGELSVGDLRRAVKRGILGWFGTARARLCKAMAVVPSVQCCLDRRLAECESPSACERSCKACRTHRR